VVETTSGKFNLHVGIVKFSIQHEGRKNYPYKYTMYIFICLYYVCKITVGQIDQNLEYIYNKKKGGGNIIYVSINK